MSDKSSRVKVKFTKTELNCLINVMGGEDITDWQDCEKEYKSIITKLNKGNDKIRKPSKECSCLLMDLQCNCKKNG